MTTALKPQAAGVLGRTEPTCWLPPTTMTYEQWEGWGAMLQQIMVSHKWWLGDWLNQGECRYGETYTQALRFLPEDKRDQRAIEQLKQAKWVARAYSDLLPDGTVVPARRRPELSFSHHRAAAHLSPAEQIEWLQRAIANDWTSDELARQIKAGQADTLVTPPTLRNSASPEQAYAWLTANFDEDWLTQLLDLLSPF